MEPLSDLQQAEELIKQEMITMLHFDCLHHPSANAANQLQRGKIRGPTSTSNNASHIAYLEKTSYKPISTEEMEQVTRQHWCLCFKKRSPLHCLHSVILFTCVSTNRQS